MGAIPNAATVKNVRETYIVEFTRDSKSSLCELWANKEEYRQYIGGGNCFISHAWETPFFEFKQAIEDYFAGDKDKNYLWIDLFCFNQHHDDRFDFHYYSDTVKSTLRTFPKVVVLFFPWKNPKPLKRAWCLWEIFCAIEGEVPFDVALSRTQQDDFLQQMAVFGENTFRAMIQGLNSLESNCFKQEERDNIHRAIRGNGGYAKVDSVIIRKMREWVLPIALAALDRQDDLILRTNLKQVIATLYKEQAMYELSEPIQREALHERIRLLGERHRDTMVSKNSLGTLFLRKKEYAEAERHFVPCLEIRRLLYEESQSPNDRVVYFKSMNNLAVVYEHTNHRLQEAEQLYRECLVLQRTHQPNESSTFSTMTNLANCLTKIGKV